MEVTHKVLKKKGCVSIFRYEETLCESFYENTRNRKMFGFALSVHKFNDIILVSKSKYILSTNIYASFK